MHWYGILGILWLYIILVKMVFSCLDEYWSYSGIFLKFYYCVLSWSRGYFHVLISIEVIEDFQQDLNWTWPLFGQVWLWMNNVQLWFILLNSFGIFFDHISVWIDIDIAYIDWVLLWFYFIEIKLNMDICYSMYG